jgi:lysozyme
MDIEKLKRELEDDEKYVRGAYPDHLGYLTIGIGRMIDPRKGGGLTREEAVYLLENDIGDRVRQLRSHLPWFDQLSDARQHALINMAFQMGVGGLLVFKKMLGYMEKGLFKEAAAEALRSRWANQTPERARRVAEMIRRG